MHRFVIGTSHCSVKWYKFDINTPAESIRFDKLEINPVREVKLFERQREGEGGGRKERQTVRQTDRQTERQTDRKDGKTEGRERDRDKRQACASLFSQLAVFSLQPLFLLSLLPRPFSIAPLFCFNLQWNSDCSYLSSSGGFMSAR